MVCGSRFHLYVSWNMAVWSVMSKGSRKQGIGFNETPDDLYVHLRIKYEASIYKVTCKSMKRHIHHQP